MLRVMRNRVESHLVRRVLQGEEAAYGQLIDRYAAPVSAVARAILLSPSEADDVVQETFVRAYQKLDTLVQPQHFGTWLISIARNTALNLRERRGRELPLQENTLAGTAASAPTVEDREVEELVQECMTQLEAEQREALYLYYFAGKPVKDVAILLGVSKAAAAKRLERARQALGTTLLNRLGNEADLVLRVNTQRKKALLGAALTAGAGWSARAQGAAAALTGATATVTSTGSMALSMIAGVCVVGGIAAAGAFFYVVAEEEVSKETASTTAAPVAMAASGGADSNTAPEEMSEGAAGDPNDATGTGRVSTYLNTLDGKIVPHATGVLEMITWESNEIPPEETFIREAKADRDGKIVFENLPFGTYNLRAFTDSLGGAENFTISENSPEREKTFTNMLPLSTLDGVVVDADGAPVEGAVLYPIGHEAFPNEDWYHSLVASLRQVTDADGRFHFPVLWPGRMRFYIYAEGHAPVSTALTETGKGMARFVIGEGGSIRGTLVRDDNGAPLAGIKVLLHADRRLSYEAVTDSDGRFEVAQMGLGVYHARIEDAALQLGDARQVTVSPGETSEVALRAKAGATIMGRVYREDTGEGVAGLEINAYGPDSSRSVRTGPTGDYIILGVGAGSVHLRLDTPLLQGSGRDLQIAADAILEGVDFALPATVTLSGTVVDVDGTPVADATLSPSFEGGARYFYTRNQDTDTLGRFSLEAPVEGTVLLSAMKEGMRSKPITLDLEDAKDENIQLVLDQRANCSVSGRVVGPSGQALLEAQIQFIPANSENGSGYSVEALPNGLFTLENIPAGAYDIQIAFNIFSAYDTCPQQAQVTLRDGEHKEGLELRCGEGGPYAIAGRVTEPDGGPAAAVEISIPGSPHRAIADKNGAFRIAGLADGSYTVRAASPAFVPVTVNNVAAGTSALALRLGKPRALRVTVLDGATGEAIPGASVEASYASTLNNILTSHSTQESDDRGEVLFERIPSDNVMIGVEGPGDLYLEAQGVALHSDSVATFDAVVQRACTMLGQVLDAQGHPVAGASIRLNATQGMEILSDADGRFRLERIPPGTASTLYARHANRGVAMVQAPPCDQGGEVPLTLRLGTPAGLTITVDGMGTAIESLHTQLTMLIESGPPLHVETGTTSDVSNALHFDDLLPGRYLVRVSSVTEGRSRAIQQEMEIGAGETREVHLVMEPGDAQVSGTVLTASPSTFVFAYLMNLDTRESAHQQITDGSFHFQDLQAGPYIFRVTGPGDGNSPHAYTEHFELTSGEHYVTQVDLSATTGLAVTLSGAAPETSYFVILWPGGSTPPDIQTSTDLEATVLRAAASIQLAGKLGHLGGMTPGDYWVSVVAACTTCEEADAFITGTWQPVAIEADASNEIVLTAP